MAKCAWTREPASPPPAVFTLALDEDEALSVLGSMFAKGNSVAGARACVALADAVNASGVRYLGDPRFRNP